MNLLNRSLRPARLFLSLGLAAGLLTFNTALFAQDATPDVAPDATEQSPQDNDSADTNMRFVPEGLAALREEAGGALEGAAHLRFIHVSADAGAVDVYFDDVLLVENLAYQVYTDFIADFPPGTYQVDLRPADAPAEEEPVYSADVDVSFGIGSTFIITGLAGAEGEDALSIFYYPTTEPEIELLENDSAEIEIVHLARGVEGVDVQINRGVLLANATLEGGILYSELTPADYTLGVAETGSVEPIIEAEVTIAPATVNSIIAYLNDEGELRFVLAQSEWRGEEDAVSDESAEPTAEATPLG